MKVQSLLKDGISYIQENNVYHFIKNDTERPMWSQALDASYVHTSSVLPMAEHYEKHNRNIDNNELMIEFFKYITEQGGVIVDVASGPSGYFSPVFSFMANNSTFIATDASKTVVQAHHAANNDSRFVIFDIDLDKGLPFKDESIDTFSANLLSNVDDYNNILSEISRSLKSGGRFAVIETFFENGTETYHFLKSQNAVFSSLDEYINVCKEKGLRYIGSRVRKEIVGKISEGDLLPIGERDKCLETIVFFEKE